MVESMLLVVILGMTAAVVGQSLSAMSTTAVTNNDTLFINDQLMAQMEVLRTIYKTASPAPTLTTPWTSSTPFKTPDGHSYTMTSTISAADATTGMTTDLGTQTNYLTLNVKIANTAYTMSTCVAE